MNNTIPYKKNDHNPINLQSSHRYLVFFTALYITLPIAATVLSYRLVEIGPFLLKGGSLIYPLTYVLGDVITEIYGYKISRQLIWTSIICAYVFAMLITIIIHMPMPGFWHGEKAFETVLGHTLRFTIGGSIGSLLGSFINVYIISKTKIYTHGKYFWLRSLFSSSFGEIIQSIIVFSIAFLWIYPTPMIINMIATAFLFKCIYSLLTVGPANYLVYFLKRKTHIDVYDFNTKFTPFSFETS